MGSVSKAGKGAEPFMLNESLQSQAVVVRHCSRMSLPIEPLAVRSRRVAAAIDVDKPNSVVAQ